MSKSETDRLLPIKKAVDRCREIEGMSSLDEQWLVFLEIDDDGSEWPLATSVFVETEESKVVRETKKSLRVRHRLRLSYSNDFPPGSHEWSVCQDLLAQGDEPILGWLQYHQRWTVEKTLKKSDDLALTVFGITVARNHLFASTRTFIRGLCAEFERSDVTFAAHVPPESARNDLIALLQDAIDQ